MFRRPFDLLAETAALNAAKQRERGRLEVVSEDWLPFVDAFRTLCVAPTAEVRGTFEEMCPMELCDASDMQQLSRSFSTAARMCTTCRLIPVLSDSQSELLALECQRRCRVCP